MIRYRLIALTLGLLISPSVSPSQISVDALRSMLRSEAGFTDEEFERARRGDAVVKTLPTKEKNEVAVCGFIGVKDIGELSMSRFAASLAQTNNESILAKGKFSTPPSIEDLRALTLGKADIEDLKKCKVGDCKLNLSAAMIEKIHKEVDWTVPDMAATGAVQVFQQLLLDYVSDYMEHGNDALIQYDNRQKAVRLAQENRLLLDKALFIDDLAPEFLKYLRDMPRTGLMSVERSLDWTTVTFGLNPIITVTDTAKYARATGNDSIFLIATKQVYASRYSDSSLALAMLVNVVSGEGNEAYVIFTNRSRSESLRGLLGGFKRSLAGGEATTRVTEMLSRSKDRLEATPRPIPPSEQPTPPPTLDVILEQFDRTRIIGLVAVVVVLGMLIVYWRKRT